jgi:Tfp pilus assembly protein PilF
MRRTISVIVILLVLIVITPVLSQTGVPVTISYDNNSLVMHLSGDQPVFVSGISFTTFHTGVSKEFYLDAMPAFQFGTSNIPLPLCFRLVIAGAQNTALPLDCQNVRVFSQQINVTDLFWYDTLMGSGRNFFVNYNGEQVAICTSGVQVCNVIIPFATNAPNLVVATIPPTVIVPTPIPGPTQLVEPPAAENEIVVVVAPFEQVGTSVQPADAVVRVLREGSDQVGGARIILISHNIGSREEAQRVSDVYNATMVVYGRIETDSVRTSYEITPRFNVVGYEVEGEYSVMREDIDDFDDYLIKGLDVAYVFALTTGQLRFDQRNYQVALSAFTWAIEMLNSARKLSLGAKHLYNYRGLTYAALGDNPQALANYNLAIEIDPSYAPAYINRGLIYFRQRDYSAAIDNYTYAIELGQYLVEAYNNRGLAYYSQGDDEAALADYNLAIEIGPSYAAAYINRGNVYYDQARYDDALTNYRLYLAFVGDNPEAFVVERVRQLETATPTPSP